LRYAQIVFDNIAFARGLKSGWGFAAVIRGYAKTILFDTGSEGDKLLSNMLALKVSPSEIDAVFISHTHDDHIGGLPTFLRANHRVEVFLPEDVSIETVVAIDEAGALPTILSVGEEIAPGIATTGVMGKKPSEQGLVLAGDSAATLVTGCAHPGVDNLVDAAGQQFGLSVKLVIGGMHLGQSSRRKILALTKRLKEMGVEQLAPSHCTGEASMQILSELFGDAFIDSGLGNRIELV
jgi:7,8-dihydropterin-6-yl-methyl-4-(beta-D-ribofuranosyl)aminobenzene 5'-phosphate synthase